MAQRMDGQDIGGPSFQYRSLLGESIGRGGDGVIASCLLEVESQPQINSQHYLLMCADTPTDQVTSAWLLCTLLCMPRTAGRRNILITPPEQGPAVLSPLCLFVYLTPSACIHLSMFPPTAPLRCPTGPCVPLDFLPTIFLF